MRCELAVLSSAVLLMLGVGSSAAIDFDSISSTVSAAATGAAAAVSAATGGTATASSNNGNSTGGSNSGSASASSGIPQSPGAPVGGSNPLIVSINGSYLAFVTSITNQVEGGAAAFGK